MTPSSSAAARPGYSPRAKRPAAACIYCFWRKNDRLGLKLRITGKGRCNVTNDCGPKEVLDNVPTGGRFLYGALSAFGPSDAMRFF